MVERVESYEQWKEEGRRGFAQVLRELEEMLSHRMKVHLKSWADRRPYRVDKEDAVKLAVELLPPEFLAMMKNALPSICEAEGVGIILPLSPEAESALAKGEPVEVVDLGGDITLTMSELVFDTLIVCLAKTALKLEGEAARKISSWIEYLNETKEAQNGK